MNRDIYSLVYVKSEDDDRASIAKILSNILAGKLKNDLQLLNYYDELPVRYAASIVSVEKDSVEMAVHNHQALIINHDKSTLIKSRHFHNELGVHCHATYVNVAKNRIILHKFAYAMIRSERREVLRVKVHDNLPITFSGDDLKIRGYLTTISVNGLSINTDQLPVFNNNPQGVLSFNLGVIPVVVPGTFMRFSKHDGGRSCCVFSLTSDTRTSKIIEQFIYNRQVEVLQQLKNSRIVQ